MGMGWVLGDFVVFGWDPVEISLSIRFEGMSRAYEDENNTIQQPDVCSMDAISRGDFAWVWVGCSEILLFLVGIPWRFSFQSAFRASLGPMRMKTIP